MARRIINGREVYAMASHLPGTWTYTARGNWATRCCWCGKRLFISGDHTRRNDLNWCDESPMARAVAEAVSRVGAAASSP